MNPLDLSLRNLASIVAHSIVHTPADQARLTARATTLARQFMEKDGAMTLEQAAVCLTVVSEILEGYRIRNGKIKKSEMVN